MQAHSWSGSLPAVAEESELEEIRAGLRALLAWEEELSGDSLGGAVLPAPSMTPLAAPAPRPREDAPSAPAPRPRQEAPAAPAPAPREEAPTLAAPGAASPVPAAPVSLEVLATEAASCTRCRLHEGRTKSVFARGSAATDLAFVGEGPGYHEDQQGLPFVGRAGQLLDRMVVAMGYTREGVYVCNVVKCRPPDNRAPKPDEAGACARYLEGQLDVVAPKAIVALGRTAAVGLGVCGPETRGWRGTWGVWRGIPVMPTYHPAFLLRSPQHKRAVWEDLQAVLRRLGRPVPGR